MAGTPGGLQLHKRGFVSLSYDGTLLCHLETALPHLERAGLPGTFYAEPESFLNRAAEWRSAHARGHEIGNGTLFGSALPDGSLPMFTPELVREEVDLADDLLSEALPAQRDFSLGLPWGPDLCNDGHGYRELLADRGRVIRTGLPMLNRADSPDTTQLKCLPCFDMGSEDMIEYAQAAADQGAWLIFAFEGIGSGDRSVDASAHQALCLWLAFHANTITVDTVVGNARRLSASAVSKAHLV